MDPSRDIDPTRPASASRGTADPADRGNGHRRLCWFSCARSTLVSQRGHSTRFAQSSTRCSSLAGRQEDNYWYFRGPT